MRLLSVNFIYLIAASSLLFELLVFKPHGKVKLFEKVATKFSGYIFVRLLGQGDLGVFQPLCPLFGWSIFLGSLLLMFVTAVMIIIEIRAFLGIITCIISPSLTPCYFIDFLLVSRCFFCAIISFSSLKGYVGKSSFKLSVTCSCFSTSLACSNALPTVLGGCHISAHMLAILFLMFFFNDEIKSFITWGCLSLLGRIPEDLYRAQSPPVHVDGDGLHAPSVSCCAVPL